MLVLEVAALEEAYGLEGCGDDSWAACWAVAVAVVVALRLASKSFMD